MKNKKKIFVLVIVSMTFGCFFLLYPKNNARAQGEPSMYDMTNGNTYYDPTTGKMTTAEEKAKEITGSTTTTTTSSAYTNQEKIPGYDPTYCFPDYMKQIINFGFAVIGILAMFMLAIGAYQYLMSAGNIGSAESAKATIGSALGGLALGLCAWLILNTINPDLVSMKNPNGLNCSATTTSTVKTQSETTSTTTKTSSSVAVSGTVKQRIEQYNATIKEASQKYNVPENIIKAVIDIESSGNPNAKNPNSTATGLMQLLAGTAKGLGVTNAKDPTQSIMGGTNYLSQMYKETGSTSWENALAAYKWGSGNLKRKAGNDWTKADAETQSYVKKAMGKSQSY